MVQTALLLSPSFSVKVVNDLPSYRLTPPSRVPNQSLPSLSRMIALTEFPARPSLVVNLRKALVVHPGPAEGPEPQVPGLVLRDGPDRVRVGVRRGLGERHAGDLLPVVAAHPLGGPEPEHALAVPCHAPDVVAPPVRPTSARTALSPICFGVITRGILLRRAGPEQVRIGFEGSRAVDLREVLQERPSSRWPKG
jgi:hypothetical protein